MLRSVAPVLTPRTLTMLIVGGRDNGSANFGFAGISYDSPSLFAPVLLWTALRFGTFATAALTLADFGAQALDERDALAEAVLRLDVAEGARRQQPGGVEIGEGDGVGVAQSLGTARIEAVGAEHGTHRLHAQCVGHDSAAFRERTEPVERLRPRCGRRIRRRVGQKRLLFGFDRRFSERHRLKALPGDWLGSGALLPRFFRRRRFPRQPLRERHDLCPADLSRFANAFRKPDP